jgi:hypothetical protein
MSTLKHEDVEVIFDLMTGLQRAICMVLVEHQGMENSIHVPDLAARLGCHPRLLQDSIKDLVEIYGLPIGTGVACGFFWMFRPEEFDAVIGNHTDRGLSNLTHASAVKRIAARIFPDRFAEANGQGRLF